MWGNHKGDDPEAETGLLFVPPSTREAVLPEPRDKGGCLRHVGIPQPPICPLGKGVKGTNTQPYSFSLLQSLTQHWLQSCRFRAGRSQEPLFINLGKSAFWGTEEDEGD